MEAMKPDTNKPKNEQRRTEADGIPVYEIRFCVQGGRDIGLNPHGGESILRSNDRYEITYFPQRRWFRVVAKNRPRPIYVHETWVSWEPLGES